MTSNKARDRAANAILALRDEIDRRIEALNVLAVEEEACHTETLSWMADLSREEVPPAPAPKAKGINIERHDKILQAMENTTAEGITAKELASSPGFPSLVGAIKKYKESCFGNDTIDMNTKEIRERVLASEANPVILQLKKAVASPKPKVVDIEEEYEHENRHKLMLCRFYAIKESIASERPENVPISQEREEQGPIFDVLRQHQRKVLSTKGFSKRPSKNEPFHSSDRKLDDFSHLEQWTLKHIKFPYPTKEEKTEMATRLGMNVSQVQHWFSNMRKRKYHPVCEHRREPRDEFESMLLQTHDEEKQEKTAEATSSISSSFSDAPQSTKRARLVSSPVPPAAA